MSELMLSYVRSASLINRVQLLLIGKNIRLISNMPLSVTGCGKLRKRSFLLERSFSLPVLKHRKNFLENFTRRLNIAGAVMHQILNERPEKKKRSMRFDLLGNVLERRTFFPR